MTYQWKKGASPLTGQTASSLTINPTHGSDAGSYSVTVTAGGGFAFGAGDTAIIAGLGSGNGNATSNGNGSADKGAELPFDELAMALSPSVVKFDTARTAERSRPASR